MAPNPKGTASAGRSKRRVNDSRTSIVEEVVPGCSRQDAIILLTRLNCYQQAQLTSRYNTARVEEDIQTVQKWAVV